MSVADVIVEVMMSVEVTVEPVMVAVVETMGTISAYALYDYDTSEPTGRGRGVGGRAAFHCGSGD